MSKKKGSKVPGKSTSQIRQYANKIREVLGLKTKRVNMIPLIEFILPKLLPEFSYEVIDESEMGVDEARTYPDRQLVYIRRDIYYAATDGDRRAQFTLAHELGHLVMHSNLGESRGYARNSQEHEIYEDSEWQADTFAAEFLMPYEVAKACTSPEEIFNEFGVSKTAAETRYGKIH